MKLESLILVNWGSLRPGEYPMGNMTLLTGPTGSGKSTLLDALQTGMTAAYQNVFNYNPSQDETTQSARNGKTKRTLWSYIVGAEGDEGARGETARQRRRRRAGAAGWPGTPGGLPGTAPFAPAAGQAKVKRATDSRPWWPPRLGLTARVTAAKPLRNTLRSSSSMMLPWRSMTW